MQDLQQDASPAWTTWKPWTLKTQNINKEALRRTLKAPPKERGVSWGQDARTARCGSSGRSLVLGPHPARNKCCDGNHHRFEDVSLRIWKDSSPALLAAARRSTILILLASEVQLPAPGVGIPASHGSAPPSIRGIQAKHSHANAQCTQLQSSRRSRTSSLVQLSQLPIRQYSGPAELPRASSDAPSRSRNLPCCCYPLACSARSSSGGYAEGTCPSTWHSYGEAVGKEFGDDEEHEEKCKTTLMRLRVFTEMMTLRPRCRFFFLLRPFNGFARHIAATQPMQHYHRFRFRKVAQTMHKQNSPTTVQYA